MEGDDTPELDVDGQTAGHGTEEESGVTPLDPEPDSDSGGGLITEVEELRQREHILLKEKEEIENDFGLKRAKFMELFKQKEDESMSMQAERDDLRERLRLMQNELDECKTQVTIAQYTKENELDEERRKYREEIASMQQIVTETMSDAASTKSRYEKEIARLRKRNEKLDSEIHDTKGQAPPPENKEGVLSVVTKTLAKTVSGLNAYSLSTENVHENLEDSMKKAQEDAEVLRSLVVPLEEEIRALKEKLRAADDEIRLYESNAAKAKAEATLSSEQAKNKLLSEIGNDLDEKLKGLHDGLQAEKSSRSDLEMYVSVLQTQKGMLQTEADDLRKQLRDVCQLLDKEKREHNELKQTWQMANDQFLEAQRLYFDDFKRIQKMLTADQLRAISDYQRKDVSLSKELVGPIALEGLESQSSSKRSSPISFPSSPHRRKSPSPARLTGPVVERLTGDDRPNDEFSFEVEKRDLSTKSFNESMSSELSEEPVRDVSTVDSEFSLQLFDTSQNREPREIGNIFGRRMAFDKELAHLHEELKLAKEKLMLPCDMCCNYEAQLQKAQDREKELKKSLKALEQSNEWHKSDFLNEQKSRIELDEKLTESSTTMGEELGRLCQHLAEMERINADSRQKFHDYSSDLRAKLRELRKGREDLELELKRLEKENDSLIGKTTATSQQMQNEAINLPDTMDEMQLLLLRLREELIVAKVAKEHIEETLRSEILFLKERVQDEQNNRESTESMFTQEIDSLREKIAILESLKMQHENEQHRRIETEKTLKDVQQKAVDTQARHKQIISGLQKTVEEGTKTKEKLERDVNDLRIRVQTLQTDLDNSEAVQRDFVKLSQTLQVQLEKIRLSEKEVRWQHDEDVDDCSNCKESVASSKRKPHCMHCGKVFCVNCLSKVVRSGPSDRPSKVCDVCHTLLDPNTAPYFSTEPPHTPD